LKKKEEISVDELKKEITRLKKELKSKKKYGLVWEEKTEDVVEICKEKLPILKEVKDKEIHTDENLPMNILIEGDNYHALSALNYTHAGKVDVIYIDPPYNTGAKNWLYNNSFVEKEDAYRHSKYISFIHHRLKIAKRLMKRGGIIICAIDDYEIHNLRHLFDDTFGEKNRLGTIVVVHNPRGRNDDKFFASSHEYMIIYSNNSDIAKVNEFSLTEEDKEEFKFSDEISSYNETSFMRTGNNSDRHTRPKLYYPIYYNEKSNSLSLDKDQGSIEMLPINGNGEEKTWRWGQETFAIKKDTELFVKKVKDIFRIYKKRRLTDLNGKKPKTIWYNPRYDASSNGIMLIQKMLGREKSFPYPKSLYAVKDILELCTDSKSIVLDYYSGSGTTGQAVLELNKEDNGKRKFILVTNNENNICSDICYPRISSVINGYNDKNGKNIEGLKSNLKYFKSDFIDSKPTDKNKKKLTEESTEMLCIKEDTFEEVKTKNKSFRVFKNGKKYTGIIYDVMAIDDFKDFFKKIDGKFSVYVFSLSDDTYEEEFKDMKNKVKLSPIPEAILRVYRRIFK
jgi:adenine-specific DNA-methyltransferase